MFSVAVAAAGGTIADADAATCTAAGVATTVGVPTFALLGAYKRKYVLKQ